MCTDSTSVWIFWKGSLTHSRHLLSATAHTQQSPLWLLKTSKLSVTLNTPSKWGPRASSSSTGTETFFSPTADLLNPELPRHGCRTLQEVLMDTQVWEPPPHSTFPAMLLWTHFTGLKLQLSLIDPPLDVASFSHCFFLEMHFCPFLIHLNPSRLAQKPSSLFSLLSSLTLLLMVYRGAWAEDVQPIFLD